jgi:meso-butanediol dehydrogenase/(S,S)-butanediol dehydrogenase/diacetyl reductase
MQELTGKIALVTGGGRGIGRAIAVALARAGCDVAVAARTGPELAEVAREVERAGRRAAALRLDVLDRAALAAAPAEVERALGPVAILVNNAGVDASAPALRTTDELWDRVLAVNLTAPFLLARACLPGMLERKFGRILNVASVLGKTGVKRASAYAAAKHGLVGLTRVLAQEGAPTNVTANALCPGWTDTRMMDEAVAGASKATGRPAADVRGAMLAGNPLGRAVTADEVASVAVLVAASPAINGQSIVIDGGELMG